MGIVASIPATISRLNPKGSLLNHQFLKKNLVAPDKNQKDQKIENISTI